MAARFLLQMAGAPGAGKSSLAATLSRQLGAVVLNMDVIKSALLDVGVAWALAGPAAYDVMFAQAADLLAQGHNVILDSPSHYPPIPERGLTIAQAAGATYRFIECVCDDEAELERRLAQRTPRRSQMRGIGWPAPDAGGIMPAATRIGVHRWETCRPAVACLVVDTTAPLATTLAEALRYLAMPGA